MTHLPDPDMRPEFYDGVPMKRLLAWLVDVLLTILFSLVIVPFTAFTAVLFFPFLMLVVGFAYRVLTLSNGSATWGMRLMAIELRDKRDQRFTLELAFFHTLGTSLSFAMFPVQLVSAVLMGSSAYGQGLTDMVLSTAALNRRRGG